VRILANRARQVEGRIPMSESENRDPPTFLH
jgi:hypothetical protein